MVMSVYIDGNLVSAESRIIETINADDEIKTTRIKIVNSIVAEAYDTDLLVSEYDGVNTNLFLTGYDSFILTGRNPFTYTHNIMLIGLEKMLEKETLTSLQYTQDLDTVTYTALDVIDRALKLLNIEEIGNLGDKRKYDISGIGTRDATDNYVVGNLSGLALSLHNTKAPEYKFNTPTLKELCDDVFELLEGRTVINTIISNIYIIDIRYYNEENNEIDINNVEDIVGEQSIEKNAQKFDIYMENAISESSLNKQAIIYPSANGWASVRSSETKLTTANFLMEVSDDIERVLKFEILANVDVDYTETDGVTFTAKTFTGIIEVDATYLLFRQRAWESLLYNFETLNDNDSTDTWWNSGAWKDNSVYFSGKQILGWHEDLDIFTIGNSNNWNTFLGTLAHENGYLSVTAGYWVSGIALGVVGEPTFQPRLSPDIEDFMYRLTYVPKTVSRLQLEKDVNTGHGTLYANQNDRIVDSEKLGINLKSKLNRDGNKQLTFTKTVSNMSNVFKTGDTYNEYRVSKVVNDKLINHDDGLPIKIESTATLGKNFYLRSPRMEIANKPRQTAISVENTNRNDLIGEYLLLTTDPLLNTSYLTQEGLSRLAETFNNDTPIYENPVDFTYLITRNATGSIIKILNIPCISQGITDTLHFKWGFDNNIVAGKRISVLDSIYANEFIRYADEKGRVETLEFDLYDTWSNNPDTFAQKALNARWLPAWNILGGMVKENKLISVPEILVLKDGGENENFTYQLKHYGITNIIIGNRMATENALVVKDTETLYLYATSVKYKNTQKIKDTAARYTIIHTGTPVFGEVKLTITVGAERVKLEFSSYIGDYMALGNYDRDLYFASNIEDETIFYLVPQKERID
jgi:hypothetical protein